MPRKKQEFKVINVYPDGMDKEAYSIIAREIWTRHINKMANEDFHTKDIVYFYMNENDEIDVHPSLEWDDVTSNWHNNKKKLKNMKL